MKKRYPFPLKTWLRIGLFTAFAFSFSLSLLAQTAPVKQWDKTIGGSNQEAFRVLEQTSDGGYILGGISESNISADKSQNTRGSSDYWVVKLDAAGNKLWDKTMGGSNDDWLLSLDQTSDGGYILGGWSTSGNSGDKSQASQGSSDYWVVKLDANGNKLWDKTFGARSSDKLQSIKQTSDGGYILGGYSESTACCDKSQTSLGYDFWVLKLDPSGNKVWDSVFGGISIEQLYALQQTSDGGYILGGYSYSGISGDKTQTNRGGSDYWIVKLDASGNKIWDKTFGGSEFEELSSLQQTTDGGYILGGRTNSGISGDKTQASRGDIDYWVVKLDINGNKSWDKTFGGSNTDLLLSINQTTDGGYILGGTSKSGINGDKSQGSKGDSDYWIVKLDSNGNKSWDQTFGGSNIEQCYSIIQTLDGGFIFGGASFSDISGDKTQSSKGASDYWIVKLGASPTGLNESEANFNLSISPNPNQGKFNLKLSNFNAPKAEVTVTDLLGQVELQKEIQTTNNQLSEELTLPDAKGIYLLQLKAGAQIITRKFMIY